MKKEKSEDRIIEAALKEFAQYGFDGARMERIAKRAKLNKAMIYYHFKGKEALYEEILTGTFKKVHDLIKDNLPQEKDPVDQLCAMIATYTDFIDSIDLDFVRLMMRELSSGGTYFRKITLPHFMTPILDMVVDLIEGGMKTGRMRKVNPYYTYFQIVGSVVFFNALQIMLAGTTLHEKMYTENFMKDFQENMVGIIRNGLEQQGGKVR